MSFQSPHPQQQSPYPVQQSPTGFGHLPPPPPMAPPPPGYHPPPAKSNTGLIIGLVVGGLVLVLALGGFAAWRFVITPEQEPQYQPVFNGDYAMTSSPCAGFDFVGYGQLVGSGPHIPYADPAEGFQQQSSGQPAHDVCGYSAAESETIYLLGLDIAVFTDANAAALDFETMTADDADRVEPAKPLGEQAFFSVSDPERFARIELHVLAGNLSMMITFSPDHDFGFEDCQEMLIGVAEAAMADLAKK